MVARQIDQPHYTIDVTGFEDLVFTESSSKYLALPQSVTFATERNSVLQSAREVWAFRVSTNGALESDRYQSTRTAAIGVKLGNQYCVAFCDSPNTDENILLTRPQEGYHRHVSGKPWIIGTSDPVVKRMIERAQEEHRVVPALERTLELSTNYSGGASPYGTHPITQAILGMDLTEHVATYLRDHGHGNGYVWTLSPKTLQDLRVDDGHVEVRRVGVGGSDYIYDMDDLSAIGLCRNIGRARGVHERSTGDKG